MKCPKCNGIDFSVGYALLSHEWGNDGNEMRENLEVKCACGYSRIEKISVLTPAMALEMKRHIKSEGWKNRFLLMVYEMRKAIGDRRFWKFENEFFFKHRGKGNELPGDPNGPLASYATRSIR